MQIFLGALLLINLALFSASYFFNKSTELYFIPIPFLLASVIFWVKQPIKTWKKPFVIIATTLLSSIIGILIVISTMLLPGSRNHDYVETSICFPAVAKHYGVNNTNELPARALDMGNNGYSRWFAQHSECEDNIYRGKGPIFSENPPGFLPIKTTKERITLQPGYYLDVQIPEGYLLKNGAGDYAKYITDAKGKDLIGFQRSSPGGELGRLYPMGINNVPLVIMYRSDPGCPANIFSEKTKFNPETLYFGINTWCKDEKNEQDPVYHQVIESIVFNPKLKEVLLGNSPPPPLSK